MIFSSLDIGVRFIVRYFLVHYLNKNYLGMNDTFVSVISMLSLAELGIGPAIVYALYQPIAQKKQAQVKALVKLYKKIYNYIGFFIGGIGLLLVPFLSFILKGEVVSEKIYVIYLLFLVNAVISYFFTYNRSLIQAYQMNYYVVINDVVFRTICSILQIFVLIFTKNLIFYLLLQILFTFLGNLFLSRLIHRKFRSIFLAEEEKIEKLTICRMKKNIVGNIANSIGEKVVFGTDNLLISAFIGVGVVGLYTNYVMIPQAIVFVLWSMISSLTATIGNVSVTENEEVAENVFRKCTFLNYIIILLFTLGIYFCIAPFIQLIFGAKYLLPHSVVIVIAVNFFITGIRNPQNLFISAYGLAWNQRYKPIVESVLNLIFSVIFLKLFHFGIQGVLLGTICSSVCTVSWIEPYVVFKYALKKPLKNYCFLLLKQVVLLIAAFMIIYFILNRLKFAGVLELLFGILIVIFVTSLVVIIGYKKSSELKYIKFLFRNIFINLKDKIV
jgi:O-antigen/teichoic acid export membrane protein